MKSFTTYHLCQDAHSADQQRLIEAIVKVANPAMIFLLGTTLQQRRCESIFQPPAPPCNQIADYFLLILLKNLANREVYEWQDKIEAHCKEIIPTTTIVVENNLFEQWLKEGHRFALHVKRAAIGLYADESYPFSPAPVVNMITSHSTGNKYMHDGLVKAKEFLAGSELFRIRKQYAMAAFMLHQSAEQALHSLLKAGTGYHANTHSIDRLLRYAGMVSYQLADIFPQKTEEDKRCFTLLQKAYIDTRYKEDYKINNDDLLYLTEKIKQIHALLADAGKSLSAPGSEEVF